MSWQDERKFREEIAAVHRRLYELGFSVANDGNTSVRVDANRILITPAGLNKAKLEPGQMALVDANGKHIGGSYAPSTEIFMHVDIFKARLDVHAIIHAHPPYSIACSLAGVTLDEYVLPEVVLTLGKVPTTPYVTTGTQEVGKVVSELIKKHDAVILDRHGTVTVGKNLDEAMQKLERVEHTARITSIARSMGVVTPLPRPEVERLIRRSGQAIEDSGSELKKGQAPATTALIDLITREVIAALAEQKSGTDKTH